MNPNLTTPLIAVLGLVFNAAWSVFNSRMEGKVTKHIDGLKDWVTGNYYDREFLDERAKQIDARLTRANA